MRNQGQQRQGNNFQGAAARKGGYNSNFRSGEKRRQETTSSSSSFKKSRPSREPREERRSSSTTKSSHKSKESKKDDPPKAKKEQTPDIPDDQVEIPDQLMDNVEKLRQRKDVERNVADEDIDKLVVFCYNGKGYDCLTCGYMLLKDSAFKNHLMSKSHVMNVIDARSDKKYQPTRDLLDIDITDDGWFEKSEMAKKMLMKQAKVMMKVDIDKKKRELENYNKDPSNFFAINMASKKCATMTGDVVRITSVVESTIDVKEFSKNRFFGCEFVKSVASFQCRLCDMKIHNASEVLPHIDSRVHRNKYQMHLRRMPEYEKKQKEQNKDLEVILQEHEGQAVLLSETNTKTQQDDQGKTLLEEIDTILVRVPEILNPPEKVKEKETEEKKDAKDDEQKDGDIKVEGDDKEKDTEESGETKTDADETVKEEPNEEQPEESMETNDSEQTQETTEETISAEVEAVQAESTESVKTENAEEVEEDKPEEKFVESEDKKDGIVPEVSSPVPEKATAKKKKGTPGRGRGVARRGTSKRGRGGKGVSASPKTRAKPVEETTEEKPAPVVAAEEAEKPTEEKDESMDASDGNFMDGFQLVDEVQEE